MTHLPGCRLTGGVLPPVPPYGDVGPFGATISMHRYLHCDACGDRLWTGVTETGAEILLCRACRLVTDTRRVA